MGQPRFDRLRGMPLLHRFAARKAMQIPAPVLPTVLAIDRFGSGYGARLRVGC